jgi:hypothetical protein
MNRIGRERGWHPWPCRVQALKSASGPLALGSPEQVAEKILSFDELFQPQRYLAHISIGAVAHADVMSEIELFGTRVVPLVRAELDLPGS